MARFVGIDLGGTAIKAGACDENGAILEHRSIATGLEEGASAVLDRMAQLARDLGVTTSARAQAATSLGIGAPGLIDLEQGRVLSSPNLKVLEGIAMRDEIAQRLGLASANVKLGNDANCAALGEHWVGAGRGEHDMLMVTLGTGVGGGLVLAGEMYAGTGGMAGEIGHVCIDPRGPKCGCGRNGCVEMFASATAARRRAIALGLPRENPGDLIVLAHLARERAGPERDLLFDIGRDLGHGLGAVVSLLDVRCFVIGGGFGAATDVLTPGIRAGINERSYGDRLATIRIVPAALGADAGWIGSARLSAS